jgi:hypothetical protein
MTTADAQPQDEPATEGPAYLDITNSVAHKTPHCGILHVHAKTTAVADVGPMTGFVWCAICGGEAFEPRQPQDEEDKARAAAIEALSRGYHGSHANFDDLVATIVDLRAELAESRLQRDTALKERDMAQRELQDKRDDLTVYSGLLHGSANVLGIPVGKLPTAVHALKAERAALLARAEQAEASRDKAEYIAKTCSQMADTRTEQLMQARCDRDTLQAQLGTLREALKESVEAFDMAIAYMAAHDRDRDRVDFALRCCQIARYKLSALLRDEIP